MSVWRKVNLDLAQANVFRKKGIIALLIVISRRTSGIEVLSRVQHCCLGAALSELMLLQIKVSHSRATKVQTRLSSTRFKLHR